MSLLKRKNILIERIENVSDIVESILLLSNNLDLRKKLTKYMGEICRKGDVYIWRVVIVKEKENECCKIG